MQVTFGDVSAVEWGTDNLISDNRGQRCTVAVGPLVRP